MLEFKFNHSQLDECQEGNNVNGGRELLSVDHVVKDGSAGTFRLIV